LGPDAEEVDNAVPTTVVKLPQEPQAVEAKPLETSSWNTAKAQLWRGNLGEALQSSVGSLRMHGLSLRVSGIYSGTSDQEMAFRFSDEYERSRVLQLLQNPAFAAAGGLGFLSPQPVRDLAYDTVADNRYSILGKRDECRLDDERFAGRFIT